MLHQKEQINLIQTKHNRYNISSLIFFPLFLFVLEYIHASIWFLLSIKFTVIMYLYVYGRSLYMATNSAKFVYGKENIKNLTVKVYMHFALLTLLCLIQFTGYYYGIKTLIVSTVLIPTYLLSLLFLSNKILRTTFTKDGTKKKISSDVCGVITIYNIDQSAIDEKDGIN